MKFVINQQEIRHNEIETWARHEGRNAEQEWIRDLSSTVLDWFDANKFIEIMTSGSTGKPKIIRIRKTAMKISAHMTAKHFDLKRGMQSLHCLPVRYIAGKMMLVRALVIGMSQICLQPKLKLNLERRGSIDFTAMTPLQLESTLSHQRLGMDSIKQCIIGGAPVSRTLEDALQELTTKFYATYGMTETITHVASRPLNGPGKSEVYTGLDGIKFSQKQENLIIQAEHLDGPILTTDRVKLLDTRHFIWLGRSDNIINKGGVKIFPEAVEKKLHGKLKERFIVVGIEDDELGEKVGIIVESADHSERFVQSVYDHFHLLNKLERPDRVIVVERLLETETGKVKRKANLYL